MRLLILGGTVFLGRHLVDSALARGHQVTLFNRGQHNPELFPQVERLRGDRTADLSALKGREWDAVIDTCGYVPRMVRASAALLAPAVGHYTFISTISVYAEPVAPGADEQAPVGTLADTTVEEVTGESYGPLKALCEAAAAEEMPGRVLQVRPGLIVGPHDPTDRFTYWPVRVAQGGEVLAPGHATRPVQVIDGRDLADWTVQMAERGLTGVYNATGPEYRLTMGALLETCRTVSGSDARFTWIDDATLLARGAGPWMEVPLWLPESAGTGLMQVDCTKAFGAGLQCRSLAETVRDTLAWQATRPADLAPAAGMTRAREAELLRASA